MLHAVMFRRVLLCGFLLLMLCGISLGQWSRDPKTNTPIATLRSHQTNPKIVSDGAGGAIITWQDSRDSATTSRGTDIYVQRINARGSNQWTNNGAIICRFDSNQITPAIVNDGGGGAIIVWQDNRNGNADIYAQHVAADSTKQWTANGIPVCTEAHEQTAPAIIRDNVGGVIIVWQDYRNGNADIYAQRIDAGGTPTWTSDGVIVCSATNDQVNPAIVKDNAGGAVIVWQDLRNNSDYDIYAQRVSSGGASLWSSNGVVISDKVNHQRYPQLIDDGSNGAIIVWEDFGNGDADIFAQHVASDGSRQWTSTGVIIAQQANDQTLPKIATDGVGGAIVSWQDARSGNADVYTQRVNASGTILWGTGGIALCSESHDQVKPNMVSDGNFGAIVTWEDSRSGNADVYAQRVTSSGSTLWASNGIAACTDTLTQSGPEIVNDGVQGAIITWQDARKLGTQGWDVYAQHVNPDGSLGGYAIHGTIYNDLNRNGVQETGETGLSGWTINISGPMSKSATSDANGIYSLDGLIPGIYVVKEVIKSGWMQTSATDSTVNLPIGGDSIRNFGNFQLATIAGVVYKDRNHNGGKDPGEPGLQNWSIKLSGPSSASALTDANGNFIFIGLFTGTFVVKADPKSGWLQTNHPDSLVVNIDTMGQDVAGLAFGQFELGKVNGKIYKDVTGDSVISPAGDSTVAGWSVSILKPGFRQDVVTDGTGLYTFANLDSGQYVVRESLYVSWIQTFPKPPGDTAFGSIMRGYKVTIDTSGKVIAGKNFGNFLLGTINGRVYEDGTADSAVAGDLPLSGWRVRLFKNGVQLDSALTAGQGSFAFNSLFPGRYTVEEKLFSGWRQTFPRVGGSGEVSTTFGDSAGPRAYQVDINTGTIATADFANFKLGMIRGKKYCDIAGDGLVLGDPPIANWWMKLYAGGVSSGSIGGAVQARVKTNSAGEYTFEGLMKGTYTVRESLGIVSQETYPVLSTPGVATLQLGERVYPVTIDSSGRILTGKDFGNFVGAINGNVFNDMNGDGIRGMGEAGLPDISIQLTGGRTDTVLTDADGNYTFAGLDIGTYTVTELTPLGWVLTLPHNAISYSVEIKNNQRYITGKDFGDFQLGVISGTVYDDLDSNGQRGSNESGLPNRLVRLSGQKKDSVLTDSYGRYSFNGLTLGFYVIKEQVQSGWIQTAPHDSFVVTVGSGGQYPNNDFGNAGLGHISGTIFDDLDRNGVKNAGDPGISSWRVFIKGTQRDDSILTDANGNYMFGKIPPGTFVLTQTLPAGWKRTKPNPQDTLLIIMGPGGTFTGKDFGNFRLATISGVFFFDHDGNGVRDPGDSGLANWKTYLTGSKIDSTLSDINGSYSFTGLDAGTYTVKEQAQPFWIRTRPDTSDSYSVIINSSGQTKADRDFGKYLPGSVSGIVYNDSNFSRSRDLGEPLLSGWRIHLARLDVGPSTDSVVESGANGMYEFTGLPLGRYLLSEEIPLGWFQTFPSVPETVVISSYGQQIEGKDFGNFHLIISGTVFEDLNGDSTKDAGEQGRAGRRLYLYKDAGLIDSTLSDAQGAYSFSNHGPGTYSLTQQAEVGWLQTRTPSAFIIYYWSRPNITGQNFGDFKKFSVSGIAFDDVNRNGIRDGVEGPLVGWIIDLRKNGIPMPSYSTLANGSFIFTNLGPGNYALCEELKPGYVKSFPVSPDTYKFSAQSGVDFSGKNFGNFSMTSKSITIRSFKDKDRNMLTRDDQSLKGWNLTLLKNGVPIKTSSSSSLDTANLADGIYVARESDSSTGGWYSLGKIHTIHRSGNSDSVIQVAGNILEDSVNIHSGESHLVDFLNFKPNKAVVRAFSDADGNASTGTDRVGQSRHLSLYTNFIAPGNFVRSVVADSVLSIDSLGDGTYLAVQEAIPYWKNILRRVNSHNRSGVADTVMFIVNGGEVDTVDFINAASGTIVMHKYRDDDANAQTSNDRSLQKWSLLLYRDSISSPSRIDSVYAESLFANVLAGNYIAKEMKIPQWKSISVLRDGSEVGATDTVHVSVGGGEDHSVEFINSSDRHTKIWIASIDGQWENSLNWSPPFLPTADDSVFINADRPWRVPSVPAHSAMITLSVNPSAGITYEHNDTCFVAGDMTNYGSILVDPNGSPAFIIGGDWYSVGTFSPGKSTVVMSSQVQRRMTGENFFNLQIGDAPGPLSTAKHRGLSSSGGVTVLSDVVIDGTLTLNGDMDAGHNNVSIVNDSPDAIQGDGELFAHSITRVIRPNATAIYRYDHDSSYVQFRSGGSNPTTVAMTIYPDTSPTNYGTVWDSVSSQLDTVENTITIENVQDISPYLPWAFGIKQSGEWVPSLRRIYVVEAQPESGFVARLSFRYLQSDVPPTIPEGSLVLLRLKLVYQTVTYSTIPDWNLVSVPLRLPSTRKNDVFPSSASRAFGYTTGVGYFIRDTLNYSTGYWLKFPSASTISVHGREWTRDTIDVIGGWNLIGPLSTPIPAASVNTIPGGIILTPFVGFNGAYFNADSLKPVNGYWVKISTPGKMTFGVGSSQIEKASSRSVSQVPPSLASVANLNTLVVRDAGGKRQTLYFGTNDNINPEVYELPPSPPEATFDVRFSNQSVVEVYSSSSERSIDYGIAIHSSKYPIEIQWKLMNDVHRDIFLSEVVDDKIVNTISLKEKSHLKIDNLDVTSLILTVGGKQPIPTAFALYQCYPNPFNPVTRIQFDLPEPSSVSLKIYDVLGREVATVLDNSPFDAGTHVAIYNGTTAASGVYFYRVTFKNERRTFQDVKKMVLMK